VFCCQSLFAGLWGSKASSQANVEAGNTAQQQQVHEGIVKPNQHTAANGKKSASGTMPQSSYQRNLGAPVIAEYDVYSRPLDHYRSGGKGANGIVKPNQFTAANGKKSASGTMPQSFHQRNLLAPVIAEYGVYSRPLDFLMPGPKGMSECERAHYSKGRKRNSLSSKNAKNNEIHSLRELCKGCECPEEVPLVKNKPIYQPKPHGWDKQQRRVDEEFPDEEFLDEEFPGDPLVSQIGSAKAKAPDVTGPLSKPSNDDKCSPESPYAAKQLRIARSIAERQRDTARRVARKLAEQQMERTGRPKKKDTPKSEHVPSPKELRDSDGRANAKGIKGRSIVYTAPLDVDGRGLGPHHDGDDRSGYTAPLDVNGSGLGPRHDGDDHSSCTAPLDVDGSGLGPRHDGDDRSGYTAPLGVDGSGLGPRHGGDDHSGCLDEKETAEDSQKPTLFPFDPIIAPRATSIKAAKRGQEASTGPWSKITSK
jgi:hypothetical protein